MHIKNITKTEKILKRIKKYKYLFLSSSHQSIIFLTGNIKINPVSSPIRTSWGVWTPRYNLEKPTDKTKRIIIVQNILFFLVKYAIPPKEEDTIVECPLGKEYPPALAKALACG